MTPSDHDYIREIVALINLYLPAAVVRAVPEPHASHLQLLGVTGVEIGPEAEIASADDLDVTPDPDSALQPTD
jgi:hypothetical protein